MNAMCLPRKAFRMAWMHASGHPLASEHVGYVASVLADGTDTAIVSVRIEAQVIGWRSACGCGWRGEQLYFRAEWPSLTGRAPTEIEGLGNADRHVRRLEPPPRPRRTRTGRARLRPPSRRRRGKPH